MATTVNSMMDDDDSGLKTRYLKKGHRTSRWRQRFFILAAVAIISNLSLLFGLAYSHYKPSRAFTLTKQDLQTLMVLLPGRMDRDEVRASIKRLDPSVEVKDGDRQITVGGFTFFFDDKGELKRVEHWTVQQAR